MSFAIFSVNPWAVLVSGALYFVLGAGWYGFLGKAWMAEIGKTPAELSQSPAQYVLSLVAEIAVAYSVGVALNAFGAAGIGDAIFIAALLWFFFALLPEIVHYAYEGKSFALLVINKGYDLLGIVVAAFILTLWR